MKKMVALLNKIKGVDKQYDYKSDACIFNPRRTEEIFLPIKELGLYVNPWLSHGTLDPAFSGFEQFITAACMFGALLQGQDQEGRRFSLVKHDRKFTGEEKVTEILLDAEAPSPYEEMFLYELERLTYFINTFKKTEQGNLLLHLPYYDYMLFGIELFIRGRMSLKALNDFFIEILLRREVYANKISAICDAHQVALEIKSPFENLFVGMMEQPSELIAIAVLGMLGLSPEEVDPEKMPVEIQKKNEKQFVLTCLEKLQTNTFFSSHAEVWRDLVAANAGEINELEDLLKVGNSFAVAYGAMGKSPHATCVYEFVTEKQIQVGYSDLAKDNKKYPPVFNLTCVDPVVNYSVGNINRGLLFFSQDKPEKATDLMITQGFLAKAHSNTAQMSVSSRVPTLATLCKNSITNHSTPRR